MRIFFITAFLFAMGFGRGGPQLASGQSSTDERPNIVIFLVDDLGWKDIGSFGSSFYETPNIDALAAEGMSFQQAYAASPVCSPTRASIMAGKNPARMNTTDWFGAPQPENVQNHWTRNKPLKPASYTPYLPLEEKTIAEALKEHGYTTFFAGKWHLGDEEKYWPKNHGFDINKGGFSSGAPRSYFAPYSNPRLKDGPNGEHLPHRLAQETASFIKKHQDQPFLAYLSFYSVHNPKQAHLDLINKYKEKKSELGLVNKWGKEGARKVRLVQTDPVYAGMVDAMDQAVGTVMQQLRDLGIEENTIVIFFSDNGGLSTSEGHPTSNMPLRAGKGWMYEGGIREPMIVKWPGVTKPGSSTLEPVISMDLYPTILESAGLPLEPRQHVDGESLLPLLKGRPMDRGPLYFHYPHYGNQGGSPASAIRKGNYKLIEFYEDKPVELYNIARDISENNNLAPENPTLVNELQGMLDDWKRSVDAQLPTENGKNQNNNNK